LTTKQGTFGRLPVVVIAGVGSSLASIFLFGKISDEVLERESMAFDRKVVGASRKLHGPELDKAMTAVTTTGEPWALAVVSGLAGVIWLKQNRVADMATLALAALGGSAINQVLKSVFRRKRPAFRLRRAHATGYSYPSGHAMTTLVTYGALALLVGRHGSLTKRPQAELVWLPTLALCALVGWSRVYLEVHYPTDVLGGWAVATVWVSTCGIARSFMEPEES
jgi:undecaprenyl-diphosphatase